MSSRIVIVDAPGQMCNQIWSYAPFLAYAKKMGSKVFVAGFHEYAHDFPLFERSSGVRIISRPWSNVLMALSRPALKSVIKGFGFDRYRERSFAIVDSWSAEKPEQELREMKSYVRDVFRLPNIDRSPGVPRVGLHVRRGDYRQWRGGKFFFGFDIYFNKSIELSSKLFPREEVEFAVASNVGANRLASRFPAAIYNPKSTAVQDLALLASCDVILGPPSTFSMWASFYNDVPLVVLAREDQEMPGVMPPYIVSQNYFSDGSSISGL